ncbi:MAG: hypothetical protein EXX96DRAFT_549576 [Benjaminiella poitrasii]|nr:MAG: hypothetical protein EXX96DRAFT_549576 [Benjaminiella poitrasii]
MVYLLSLVLSAALVSADVSNYWKSFTTKVDPRNVTIPSITQTESLDPFKECVYYNPDPEVIDIVDSEWPEVWVKATSNGMNETEEFRNLYNSIDWSKAPNIPVRTANAEGVLNMTGYNSTADPDCWWSASGCVTPKLADVNKDIYYCPEPNTWGLTYDDGPNCSHNAFYDFLQEKELKATLFYIGSNVIDWPYEAMRGIQDGHQIGCHTWSHPLMTTFTNEEVLAEFYYAQKAIKLATGLTPRFWRPPYGDIDNRVRWIATQLGLTAVVWNLDTNDWSAVNAATTEAVQENYDAFIEMGKNGTFDERGTVVLAHELTNTTMSLAIHNLPDILDSYKNVINIATCHNISYPYFEDYEWTEVMNRTITDSKAKKNTTTTTTNNAAQHNALKSAGNTVGGSGVALLGALAAAFFLI